MCSGEATSKRSMHEKSDQSVSFKCLNCNMSFSQEANLINHKEACGGAKASSRDKRRCDNCNKDYAYSSFAAHRKRCVGVTQHAHQASAVQARVYKRERVECEQCGGMIAATNKARHKKTCQGGRAFQ